MARHSTTFDRVTIATLPHRMLRAIHNRRRSPTEYQGRCHPIASGRREPTEDAIVRPPDRVRVERTVVRRQRVENGFRWTTVTSIVVAIVVICEDEIAKIRNIILWSQRYIKKNKCSIYISSAYYDCHHGSQKINQ